MKIMPQEKVVRREREKSYETNCFSGQLTMHRAKNNFARINYYGYFKRVCVSMRIRYGRVEEERQREMHGFIDG